MQYLCLYFSLVAFHGSYSFSFNGTRYATAVPTLLARPGHGSSYPHGSLPYNAPLLSGQATSYNNAVAFKCPFGQVLLVQEFGDNEVKMGCGIADICNEQRVRTITYCSAA